MRYNSTGIKIDDYVIPDGEYDLKIVSATPGKTKAGDDKVTVDLAVASGQHLGFVVRFHTVTFFLNSGHKAAGLAIKFLKTIGEPYEGEFDYYPDRWVGKKLTAYLCAEEYNGRINMKVQWVKPIDKIDSQDKNLSEDVPF